ncbi:MAG: hypothetical protein IJW17_10490 [Lentisphaeria bacterium]|nr:hypothetical protein [Lentisphaeria bacterium]
MNDVIIENYLFKCTGTAPGEYEINFRERSNNEAVGVNDYSYFFSIKDLINVKNASFIITGRLTVTAYFAAGFYLTLWGAGKIRCRLPGRREYQIFSGIVPPEKKPWLKVKDNVWSLCPNTDAGDGFWKDDVLHRLDIPIDFGADFSDSSPVIFTGQGSVLMYAASGMSAALANSDKRYRISTPASPQDVIFSKESITSEYAKEKKNGQIIGILGDPNSGKSVFSAALTAAVKQIAAPDFSVWLKDCDKAAPTPYWYLRNTAPDSDETQIRKRIKTGWTLELEDMVREELSHLRSRMDLLIADMPGGKHPKDPAPKAERIPGKGRGEMFAECDGFIILCRSGGDHIFNAWKNALKEYGLEGKIIGRFNTYLKDGEGFFMTEVTNQEGLFTADLYNLKRDIPSKEIIPVMAEKCRFLTKYLFPGKTDIFTAEEE